MKTLIFKTENAAFKSEHYKFSKREVIGQDYTGSYYTCDQPALTVSDTQCQRRVSDYFPAAAGYHILAT